MHKEYKYIDTNSKELCDIRTKARALLKEFDALDFDETEKSSKFLNNYSAQ